jgi:hypothetical protein
MMVKACASWAPLLAVLNNILVSDHKRRIEGHTQEQFKVKQFEAEIKYFLISLKGSVDTRQTADFFYKKLHY